MAMRDILTWGWGGRGRSYYEHGVSPPYYDIGSESGTIIHHIYAFVLYIIRPLFTPANGPSAPVATIPPHLESVYIDISSASNSSVDFVLSPTFVKHFAFEIDRKYNVTASPSEPAYHQVRDRGSGVLREILRIRFTV